MLLQDQPQAATAPNAAPAMLRAIADAIESGAWGRPFSPPDGFVAGEPTSPAPAGEAYYAVNDHTGRVVITIQDGLVTRIERPMRRVGYVPGPAMTGGN